MRVLPILLAAVFMAAGPAAALETVTTFEATCTTPQSVFQLGDTVCAKVENAAGGDLGAIWLQWVAPDNTVAFGSAGSTVVTANGQTFTQALPTTGATARQGRWQARTANVSDSVARASAVFRVPRMSVIGVRRDTPGSVFYFRNSNTTGVGEGTVPFGIPGDIGLMGDWDGDGVVTPGVYRPSDNAFYLSNSPVGANADVVFQFGPTSGSPRTPLVGDWDGDGVTTVGIHQDDVFYLRNSNSAGPADLTFVFGIAGDLPVAGDWNGDGVTTIGVYRNGAYFLRNSNDAGLADLQFGFGIPGDLPIAGDWDADGTTTIGVYRSNPGESAFYLKNSNDESNGGAADVVVGFGVPNDQPLVHVHNEAPVVTAGGTLPYPEGQAATAIDPAVTVTDMDSAILVGATVQITNNCASEDVLSVTAQNNIVGVYTAATCLLTLNGRSSVANYQTALRSVAYNNSSDNPSTAARTVTWQVDDGAVVNNLSNLATSTINVAAKQSQTITFTSSAPGAAAVGGPTYTVTATGGGSGNPVTFTIDATATTVCSIAGSTVSFIGVGTCVIDANQAGNATYDAAPQVQQSFAAGKGSQTITFTSSAPGAATVGGPTYTVTATGGASGNPVTFTIDASATLVCSIVGSTVSFTAVGTCVIDANQTGDTNYNSAPQVQQSFAVGKGSQAINFTSTAPSDAKVGGPTYTVTATGGASGNSVTFTIDAVATNICSIVGSTVSFGPNPGTCVIDANQLGNANYNAAPQVQQSFLVHQAPAFTSAATATFAPGKTGQTFNVTTTGSPTNTITRTGTLPSGVTFTDNGNNTATIAGTPAAGTQTSSPYSWILTASNGTAPDAVQNPFTFNVTCPTINVSGTIPALTYNVAMSTVTFTQTNGNGTIAWSQTGLPTGVGINSSNGQVTGTPTVTGTFNVTVTATDAGGCTGSKNQSVTVAPVATGDAYTGLVDNTQLVITGGSTGSPATPFVGKTTLLTANDQPTGGVSATAGTFATSAGGSVTIAADGTFVYTPKANPAAGRTTSDSFTYTVTSNTGGGAAVTSAAATVNLTLVGRVWYVLNNGAAGNGQSQSPFNTLSAAIAASTAGASATDTDTIYVYQGDGATTNLASASVLKAFQRFIGQGVALVVNSNTLVGAGGFPLIGNTLTLANDVIVNGIDMSTAASSALVGVSTTNLNVTVRNLTTSTGTALNLSGATHPTGTVTVSTVTTSGGGSGAVNVSLTNVDATVALNGGALAGAGANTKAIDINGGTGSFTYTGTISNTGSTGTNGGGISVANKTGTSTVTLSGATITLNTGANTGFNMSGNSAGTTVTINPAGGGNGLDITTTSGNGFNATSGGTVNVQGAGNTISSGAGIALNVSSTTIGASGLTFRSISANGAPNGIALTNTGSTAGLTVTGNSSGNCGGTVTVHTVGTAATVGAPVIADCTGGTIQASTGVGIVLNNTQHVSLTRMYILNSGTDGINALTVNNFTLDHSYITDNSGGAGDRGIEMGDFSTGTPVNGTINITNSTIGPTPHDNMGVGIASGTSTWNITSTVFTGSVLNSGFNFENRNATVSSFVIDGSVFQNQFADGMQMQPASGTSGTITSATIQNSTFSSNNIGMDLNHDGTASVTYKVLNNTFLNQVANSVNFFSSASAGTGGALNGRFVGNVIGDPAVFQSGGGVGIRININGGADSTVLVDDNTIRQIPNGRGIEIISRNGTGGLDATVTNNEVNTDFVATPGNGGFSLSNIFLQSNCVGANGCNTLRSDVRSNTVPASPPNGELVAGQLVIIRSSGAPNGGGTSTNQLVDNAPASPDAASELASHNTGSTAVSGTVTLIPGPINTPP